MRSLDKKSSKWTKVKKVCGRIFKCKKSTKDTKGNEEVVVSSLVADNHVQESMESPKNVGSIFEPVSSTF